MRKRIASTLGLWAVIIAVLVLFGADGGVLLLAALTALTQIEFYQLLEKMGYRPLKALGAGLGLVLVLGSYYLDGRPLDLLALAMIVLAFTLLVWPNIRQVFLPTLFGLIYVPFMLQFYTLIMHDYGTVMVPIWIVAVSKFSDVGGLLVGMKFGKHKLCPHISPKKTIEGALGGVAVSALVGVLLLAGFPDQLPDGLTWLKAALIAAILGDLALVSDLIESILKRRAGVKDSGSAIPGIGGIFDLTDSLILTAPAGYLLFKYLV
ncbi:phosphatidate cytidylyltransferase [Ruficoccus sp. ZRK36]|uniref:phosphatidate cytidylyltransferase n=1 Tax=Ruficoccus sp. ZRK36 TaxID=2866311 RepID=UPI001C73528C|nr:phosphatidate cytidylyltransferase [Ruficoccus sp. ZRK36]QYY36933.1 phosphatidate cytidylyltransferase [Ruficoccus sp. ZRK36]